MPSSVCWRSSDGRPTTSSGRSTAACGASRVRRELEPQQPTDRSMGQSDPRSARSGLGMICGRGVRCQDDAGRLSLGCRPVGATAARRRPGRGACPHLRRRDRSSPGIRRPGRARSASGTAGCCRSRAGRSGGSTGACGPRGGGVVLLAAMTQRAGVTALQVVSEGDLPSTHRAATLSTTGSTRVQPPVGRGQPGTDDWRVVLKF
jgi:hypothetical protein